MYQTMKSFKRMLVLGMMSGMLMFMAANSTMAMDMESGHDMDGDHVR